MEGDFLFKPQKAQKNTKKYIKVYLIILLIAFDSFVVQNIQFFTSIGTTHENEHLRDWI